MSFQNVAWNENDALLSSKIQKMIDNDKLNYHLCSLAPLGYLSGVNIEDIPSASRTLNQTNATVAKILLKFDIHNKNAKLDLNSSYSTRFLKFCSSDIRISDPTTTDRATSGNFLPNQRLFRWEFFINRPAGLQFLPPVKLFSIAKPSRYTTSGANAPANWTTQAFEFLYPINFRNESEKFELQIDLYKDTASVTPGSTTNNTYTLVSGNLWVEDAGARIEGLNASSEDGLVFPV